MNPLSDVRPTTARIQNSLVEVLNQKIFLPKYVLVVPDIDILKSLNAWGPGAREKIEIHLNWLIDEIVKLLIARREDLKDKHPGAVTADLTRVVWVTMLTRPFTEDQELKKIWALKKLFNDVLQKLLLAEKYMHIVVPQNMEEKRYFDKQGNLSSSGANTYWIEINKSVKELDSNYNTWKTKSHKSTGNRDCETSGQFKVLKKDREDAVVTNARRNLISEFNEQQSTPTSVRRKLPTPPPKRHFHWNNNNKQHKNYFNRKCKDVKRKQVPGEF